MPSSPLGLPPTISSPVGPGGILGLLSGIRYSLASVFSNKNGRDDEFVRKILKGKPLSRGMFMEIHVDALRDITLELHENYKLGNDVIPSKTKISLVKVITESVPLQNKSERRMVRMVSFRANNKDHTVSEDEFSILLKRCLRTTATMCFTLEIAEKR